MNITALYATILEAKLPGEYKEVMQEPEVRHAAEEESADVLCFRVLAALARKESDIRHDTDNHSGTVSDLAAEVMYACLPYSELLHVREPTDDDDGIGKKCCGVMRFHDPEISALFDEGEVRMFEYKPAGTEGSTRPQSEMRFSLCYGIFGFYHGKGGLADVCEQAEQLIKSRRFE